MAERKSPETAPSNQTGGVTAQPSEATGGPSGASIAPTETTTASRRTPKGPLLGRKFKRKFVQFAAAIAVNLNVLPYGIALAWAGSILPLLTSEDTPLSTGPISEIDKTLLSAALPFMALVATPVFSFMSYRVSRKLMGYIIAALQLASWLMFMISDIHILLYVGRVLVGVAAGGTCIQVPTYVSEIAEDEIRGSLGCILLFALNTGVLVEFIIAASVPYQIQIIIYFFLPIIFIVCNISLPETPYFLLKQNREEEARKALNRLRAGQDSKEWLTLKAEFESEIEEAPKHPFKMIMASRGMKRGLTITVVACISQQLSGIFGILSYSGQIFTEAGGKLSPDTAAIIIGLLQLFGTIISVLLVDNCGRRFLLIVSGTFIVITQAMIAVYFTLKSSGVDVSAISLIPIVSLSGYMVVFSLGLSPLPFVLLTELLPHSVASFAASISLTCLWTAATFITVAFNPLSIAIGVHSCFILFTVCTIFATIFIILCLPETKGRSLSEIATNLEEGSWIIFKKRSPEPTPTEAPTGTTANEIQS